MVRDVNKASEVSTNVKHIPLKVWNKLKILHLYNDKYKTLNDFVLNEIIVPYVERESKEKLQAQGYQDYIDSLDEEASETGELD